jgi:ribose transport system permease protein
MRKPVSFGFDRFSGLYLWAAFIVAYSIWQPQLFPTLATLHSVAAEQAISAMLAIAVLIPLAGGAYDLSVGAVANLSTVVVASLQSNHGWPMWPAIVVAILTACAVGVLNALVVVRLRVNSFIATLGMATIVGAVQTIVSGDVQILPPTSAAWNNLTQRQVFGFQIVFLYLIVIAVVAWWALDHTPGGRYIHAIGGNFEAARLSGINVGRWTATSLIVSGTLSGVAGVMYASLSGPSLTYGQSLLLPAFAAVFLGSTQIKPGRFNVWGTMLAIYVLATGVKGLQLVTGVQWLSDMFNGVALILAVAFAVSRQRATAARRVLVRRRRDPGAADPPVPQESPPAAGVQVTGGQVDA